MKTPSSPSRRSPWRALSLAVAMFVLTAGTPAAAQPSATAARTCSVPKYPGLGYFTSLSVTGTSCATGSKLVIAYYHCRTHSGPAGTCHRTVLGYTCHERRNSIPTEIEARVSCRRGSAMVVHTYQQDT